MNVSSVNVAWAGPIHQPIVQDTNSPAGLVDREAFIGVSTSEDVNTQSAFFKKCDWWHDFKKGNYGSAAQRGKELLKECDTADPDAYGRICKGFPYVWIGIAALLVHDYEAAVFFIDAAASEDARMRSDNRLPPDHIASRFLTLNKDAIDKDVNTSVGALVGDAIGKFEELLADYNTRPGCAPVPLTLDDVRSKFLKRAVEDKPGWRSLATSFISFALEWKDRSQWLDLRPGPGTAEPFFLHLFKGCLLFESLLREKAATSSTATTLCGLLVELSPQLVRRQMNFKSDKWDISGFTFEEVMRNLPDNWSIEHAITLTGRVRNTVGHSLGWNADLKKYDPMVRMIGSSCLHAIACLYP